MGRKKVSKVSEKDIENAILEYLNFLPQCKAWKNQSVGIFDPYKRVYRKSFSRWTAKGTSDIIGIINGKMLCLEVKTQTGRLSPDQKAFLVDMSMLGAIAACVRSVEEVKDLLFPKPNPIPHEQL